MTEVNADARAPQTSPQGIAEPWTPQEVQRKYLNYRECETLVGLSRGTLWKLINAGEIEAAHVGRAVRISRSSLLDFMRRSTESPSATSNDA